MEFVGSSRERLKAALALPRVVVVSVWPRSIGIGAEVLGMCGGGASIIDNPREYFAKEPRRLPDGDPVVFGTGDTRLAIRELVTAGRRGTVLVHLPDILETLDFVREEEAAGTPFGAFGGIASVVEDESGALRVDALAFDEGVLAKLRAGASAPLILEDLRGEGE